MKLSGSPSTRASCWRRKEGTSNRVTSTGLRGARGGLALGQLLQDPAPNRIAQNVERVYQPRPPSFQCPEQFYADTLWGGTSVTGYRKGLLIPGSGDAGGDGSGSGHVDGSGIPDPGSAGPDPSAPGLIGDPDFPPVPESPAGFPDNLIGTRWTYPYNGGDYSFTFGRNTIDDFSHGWWPGVTWHVSGPNQMRLWNPANQTEMSITFHSGDAFTALNWEDGIPVHGRRIGPAISPDEGFGPTSPGGEGVSTEASARVEVDAHKPSRRRR